MNELTGDEIATWKCGDPEFKARSDYQLVVSGSSQSSGVLVHRQLVCLLPAGIHN